MKQPILFSTNLLGYAALGTFGFAFICTCLALGLPYWQYYDITLGDQQTISNHGLWRYCIDYIPDTTALIDVCGDPVDIGNKILTFYSLVQFLQKRLKKLAGSCSMEILQ
jgi:hypothetical protein